MQTIVPTIENKSVEKYPAYKESGVEWLGQIPAHWEVRRLKNFFKESNSVFIDGDWIESKDINGNDVKYITTGNIGEGFYKEQGDGFIAFDTFKKLNCTEAKVGDILISRLNLPLGRCCIAPKFEMPIVVSVDVVICRMDSIYNRKYFMYLMNCSKYQDFTDIESRGAIMKRISRTILGNFYLSLPPLSEQSRIAHFLDRKTAQIDKAIAIKEKQIELLKERRQILIHNAVTRGLNPNVPMKDSGVEWIGEIPAHWEVKRLKYFVNIQGGFAFNSNDFKDEGIQIIKIANTYMNELCLDRQPTFVDESFLKSHKDWIVSKGDILMSLTGTLGKKDYGFAILIENNEKFLLNQRVAKLSPKPGFESEYILNILQSEMYLNQLYMLPAGTKQANLSNDNVLNIKIAFPSNKYERLEILKFINSIKVKIINAINLKQKEIEKLKEYKATLINSAVTGKIKV